MLQFVICALTSAGVIMLLWGLIGAFFMPFCRSGVYQIVLTDHNLDQMEHELRGYSWLYRNGIVGAQVQLQVEQTQVEQVQFAEHLRAAFPFVTIVLLRADEENEDR